MGKTTTVDRIDLISADKNQTSLLGASTILEVYRNSPLSNNLWFATIVDPAKIKTHIHQISSRAHTAQLIPFDRLPRHLEKKAWLNDISLLLELSAEQNKRLFVCHYHPCSKKKVLAMCAGAHAASNRHVGGRSNDSEHIYITQESNAIGTVEYAIFLTGMWLRTRIPYRRFLLIKPENSKRVLCKPETQTSTMYRSSYFNIG